MTSFLSGVKSLLTTNLVFPLIFWVLLIVYRFCNRSRNTQRRSYASQIPLLSLFLIILLVSPPFLEMVTFPLYLLTPDNADLPADAVVVLGGGVEDFGCPTPFSIKRAYTGSKLFLEGRASFLIFSTGRTNSHTDQTEAKAMEIIALGLGIPKNKLLLEEKSYNTVTNARETFRLLKATQIQSIILVTSSHHLYRAMKVFEKNTPGIQIVPYATEKKRLLGETVSWSRPGKLFLVLYEYAAILLYTFNGWI